MIKKTNWGLWLSLEVWYLHMFICSCMRTFWVKFSHFWTYIIFLHACLTVKIQFPSLPFMWNSEIEGKLYFKCLEHTCANKGDLFFYERPSQSWSWIQDCVVFILLLVYIQFYQMWCIRLEITDSVSHFTYSFVHVQVFAWCNWVSHYVRHSHYSR